MEKLKVGTLREEILLLSGSCHLFYLAVRDERKVSSQLQIRDAKNTQIEVRW